MRHGPKVACDKCEDCSACWDLDYDMNRIYREGVHTIELDPGVISFACNRCDGSEVWCPDYDETLCDDCQSSVCQCDGVDA